MKSTLGIIAAIGASLDAMGSSISRIGRNLRKWGPTFEQFKAAYWARNVKPTQGFNRYMYTGGNPVKYIDPSGNNAWDFCLDCRGCCKYLF